jgi:UDP-N-acetylglucosamine 2-epimerase (non-hydrolysing)
LVNTTIDKKIRFLKPFGFGDYVKLQMKARCTISDSGTISEESAILNFPAVTLRNAMERPEALDAGSISLTGFDAESVLTSIMLAIYEKKNNFMRTIPSEYTIPNTSIRVLKLIVGTHKLSNRWDGIEKI